MIKTGNHYIEFTLFSCFKKQKLIYLVLNKKG